MDAPSADDPPSGDVSRAAAWARVQGDRRSRSILRQPWREPPLPRADPAGAKGQHPRVRRRGSLAYRRVPRRRERLARARRRLQASRPGDPSRCRPEPHGHRRSGEPLVVGRSRGRACQPLRASLRCRLGISGGATAPPDPAPSARRPLRSGARGRKILARALRWRRARALRRSRLPTLAPFATRTARRRRTVGARPASGAPRRCLRRAARLARDRPRERRASTRRQRAPPRRPRPALPVR